jgi:hypothetical protein
VNAHVGEVELFFGPCDGERARLEHDPNGGYVARRRLDDTSTAIYRFEDGRAEFVIVVTEEKS